MEWRKRTFCQRTLCEARGCHNRSLPKEPREAKQISLLAGFRYTAEVIERRLANFFLTKKKVGRRNKIYIKAPSAYKKTKIFMKSKCSCPDKRNFHN